MAEIDFQKRTDTSVKGVKGRFKARWHNLALSLALYDKQVSRLFSYCGKSASNRILRGTLILCCSLLCFSSFAEGDSVSIHSEHTTLQSGHSPASTPEPWSVIPFVLLLVMIATGPLFYSHFWHKNYPAIAMGLGAFIVIYYLFVLNDQHHPVHTLVEYISFISLLTALFAASGGILISVDKRGTPFVNCVLLLIGAVIANVIGTTGASMLLIRPFIRLNKERIKPYHIVFFIFIVSNVGGSLTPIGDPPLFLGFLKGVPFFWTLEHLLGEWLLGIGALLVIFYLFDNKNYSGSTSGEIHSGEIRVYGLKNLIWLAVTIGAVFLDPGIFTWLPYIPYHGDKLSFIRETVMLVTAFVAYRTADKSCLDGNGFNFEPIKEVAFIFIGIFGTMMPALQLISAFAKDHAADVSKNTLYWASGLLSSVLDNAPTYLNFLSAGLGGAGLDIMSKTDVAMFANSPDTVEELAAISIACVFFGACTYIGNAPNFMVKSIAEQSGVEMPSFAGYVIRYTIPFLLPVLLLTWLVFILM